MAYDFATIANRRESGSAKYAQMLRLNPQVSPGIVPFTVADMDFRTAPEVLGGLQEFLNDAVFGYEGISPEYTSAVCGWMDRRHRWTIQPEWLVSAPGVVSAMFMGIKAFTQTGDGIIVQPPVYYPFYRGIEINNRRVVRNPLLRTDSGYRIDFDDLERKAADPDTKALLFCSPHNPVGRVWTREELDQLVRICERHNLIVLSDEIHFDLIMPGYRHTVLAACSEQLADRMMVCTAPSKTFNLAGMHLSNIVIPNQDLRQAYIREATSSGQMDLNALGYKACEIAYNQCEGWLDELIEVIWNNHRILKQFVAERMPEITVFDLEGSYLQWLDFNDLGIEEDELERRLHSEAEVFLVKGDIFGLEGSGYQRMNLACPETVLTDALWRLEKNLRR